MAVKSDVNILAESGASIRDVVRLIMQRLQLLVEGLIAECRLGLESGIGETWLVLEVICKNFTNMINIDWT